MNAQVSLDVQYAGTRPDSVPTEKEFHKWVKAVVPVDRLYNVVIRVVTMDESCRLNTEYRGKQKPTNVLSFPMHVNDESDAYCLGDIVICDQVVEQEAEGQGKDQRAHWAHLTVHGVLHLLGFDHENPQDASQMEDREVEILAGLGYQDPYVLVDQ